MDNACVTHGRAFDNSDRGCRAGNRDGAPVQLAFSLEYVPREVREHGLRAAHKAPRVGRVIEHSGFWSGRVPVEQAVWHRYPYIDLMDAGSVHAAIWVDCDDRPAMGAGIGDLPPVNVRVWTRRGAHLGWFLADPVGKHQSARAGPERFLARISEFYHATVGADPGFSGLGRNPAHRDARTEWGREEPYTLAALATVIPFGWKRPPVAVSAIGRNVDVFRATLRGDLKVPAITIAHAVNAQIGAEYGYGPLPDDEIAGIARSVERYREKWARQGHAPKWIARQASRGRRSGEARRKRTAARDAAIAADYAAGVGSQRDLAAKYGLSRRAVRHIVQREIPLLCGAVNGAAGGWAMNQYS